MALYDDEQDTPLEAMIRVSSLGLIPAGVEQLSKLTTRLGGGLGGALRSPRTLKHVESVVPGAGGSVYGAGERLEEWASGREKEQAALEQAREAALQAGLQQAMGSAYQPPQAAPQRSTPKPNRAESIREAADIGVPAQFVGPTREGEEEPPDAHLARLGVEPWKIDEWKKQAMASPSQEGPFAVREGRGGFSPSAKVPHVAMLEPADFMYERSQQSPAVQRLMDENYANAMRLRAQAAALEQAKAGTEATRAETGMRRAQAAEIQRGARPLPEQLGEQVQAYRQLLGLVQSSPQVGMLVDSLMQEWDSQNPEATDEERQLQRIETLKTAASQLAPGYRDMLQSLDPEFAIGYARATGLSAGF